MFEQYIRAIDESALDCAYYIGNAMTKELVYLNIKTRELLDISDTQTMPISCCERFTDAEICDFCTNNNLEYDIFTASFTDFGPLETLPYRQSTLLREGHTTYLLVLAFAEPQAVPSLGSLVEKPNFDEAMISCTNAILDEGETEKSLQKLTEIANSFYCGTKTCLLEIDNAKQILRETYSTSSAYDTSLEKSGFDHLPADLFAYWKVVLMEGYEVLVLDCKKKVDPDSTLAKVLKAEKVTSFLLAAVTIEGEIVAYLMIKNPLLRPLDFRLLCSLVLFFQEGLHKRKMLQEIDTIADHDLVTGFYNHQRYLKQIDLLHLTPPQTLGIVTVDIKPVEEFMVGKREVFDDVMIKNLSFMVAAFFTQPFYRVDHYTFLSMFPEVLEDDLTECVDELEKNCEKRGTVPIKIQCLWCEGDEVLERIDSQDLYLEESFFDYYEEEEIFEEPEKKIQDDLFHAIESKEFQVYLQPKVRLRDGSVTGAEALIRRKSGRNGNLVYPSLFVEIYEEQAIIRHLDLYVVDYVCKVLSQWIKLGVEIPISVNFSRVTLTEFGIVQTICDICNSYQVPHHLIAIEFTEQIAMMNKKAYHQIAEEFEECGFMLSLDNFGAAYSNLITLANIDINEIKIDKSLIDHLESESKNKIILKSIIDMCNLLEITKPLAEGVDSKFQADILKDMGCVYGQGEYFSPALSIEEFYERFLAKE